uniref:Chromo domain-containing protein n=1 Tax=Oncorhynchus kisutch TaxID=8019 RepID=A0A8C7GCN1_ONCKI
SCCRRWPCRRPGSSGLHRHYGGPHSYGGPTGLPAAGSHLDDESDREVERKTLRRKGQRNPWLTRRSRRIATTVRCPFYPGDRVWLSRNLPLCLPCKKLSPRLVGPFNVLRRVNKVTYRLQLPSDYRISPSFHISLLRLVVAGPLAETVPHDTPPLPLDIEGGPTYAVRSILDSRHRAGWLQYLVDWEGYGPEERCWVLVKDILDPNIICDFYLHCPDRPAPHPQGLLLDWCCPAAGATCQCGGDCHVYSCSFHAPAPHDKAHLDSISSLITSPIYGTQVIPQAVLMFHVRTLLLYCSIFRLLLNLLPALASRLPATTLH